MASRQTTKRGYGKDYQYGKWELSAAERANLPQNIKCRRCEKVKPSRFFSNNQLKELVTHISTYQRIKGKTYDAKTAVHINCETCSGKPAVELECYKCGAWKVLDAFTKAQRKNGDLAKCQKCMEEIQSLEPTDYDDQYGLSDGDDDDDDGSECSDGYGPVAGTVYTSTVNSMRDMSMTSASVSASVRVSESGGVSLAGDSSRAGHGDSDDENSETSSISIITTKNAYNEGRTAVQNNGKSSANFAKVRALPPHLIVAKDFQEKRKREIAAGVKNKAQRNGAEPDDLDDVAVMSSDDESD